MRGVVEIIILMLPNSDFRRFEYNTECFSLFPFLGNALWLYVIPFKILRAGK